MLSDKLKPHYNRRIFTLQYCKWKREQDQNAEEWIGHFRIKANECGYKEKDKILKEQLINGINDDDMMTDIMKTNCDQEDKWNHQQAGISMARKVEAQRALKMLIEVTKCKKIDVVKKQRQKKTNNSFDRTKASRRETHNDCKYCGSTHEPWGAQSMAFQGVEN